MLDTNLKIQLKGYLVNIRQPIELVASADESAKSGEMLALLDAIAELSSDVEVVRQDDHKRRPPS